MSATNDTAATKPEATDGDWELALYQELSALSDEAVRRFHGPPEEYAAAKDLIASHVAARLAPVEAERDALRLTVAKMRGNLQRIELMIPTDRNERTGERGIFHDEQPDSPGGFLPCDCDELAEEILNYVRTALRDGRK